MDEPIGRASAIDQCLEERGEQRRKALSDGECGKGEPAACPKEEQSDERERDDSAEPAPKPVEHERNVGEQRRLEVMHRCGPAAIEVKRSCRDEEGDQHDEREHRACCPKSMRRVCEEEFGGRLTC